MRFSCLTRVMLLASNQPSWRRLFNQHWCAEPVVHLGQPTVPRHPVRSKQSTHAPPRLLLSSPRRAMLRSEESRVGKEGVSTCRSRWAQYHKEKRKQVRLSHIILENSTPQSRSACSIHRFTPTHNSN